jgi:hypothetical protein
MNKADKQKFQNRGLGDYRDQMFAHGLMLFFAFCTGGSYMRYHLTGEKDALVLIGAVTLVAGYAWLRDQRWRQEKRKMLIDLGADAGVFLGIMERNLSSEVRQQPEVQSALKELRKTFSPLADSIREHRMSSSI